MTVMQPYVIYRVVVFEGDCLQMRWGICWKDKLGRRPAFNNLFSHISDFSKNKNHCSEFMDKEQHISGSSF